MASWDELTALRPGVAVRIGGETYELERTLCLEEPGKEWVEHRLSSAGTGRSLWLEVPPTPGPVIVYEHSAVLDRAPAGGPEIEHAGEPLPLLASGRASYRSVERGSAPKRGVLRYQEYARGDLHVTYENRGDKVWEISVGLASDAAAIEIVA